MEYFTNIRNKLKIKKTHDIEKMMMRADFQ
jgi:hypothetical protein